MSRLSIDALRELRLAASSIADEPKETRYKKAVKLVTEYLTDERQSEAIRHAKDEEGESSRRIYEFWADWIVDSTPDLEEPAATWLNHLLDAARKDRNAYDAVRPVIAKFLLDGPLPKVVRKFVADDYSGNISPKAPTRQRSVREWMKQEQLAQAVFALKKSSAAKTKNEAQNIVAEAASAADFEPPKAAVGLGENINRLEHVRTATRLSRDGMIGRITST